MLSMNILKNLAPMAEIGYECGWPNDLSALEWSRGHGPYLGLGRYSLDNAWRLDHILERSERFGVKIDLTLINHVQFNTAYHWNVNP